jgi:hypothetical protein
MGAVVSEAVALFLAPRPGAGRARARGRTTRARDPAARVLSGCADESALRGGYPIRFHRRSLRQVSRSSSYCLNQPGGVIA